MNIKIKYDGQTKTVLYSDFVKQSHKMLTEFGLRADEHEIKEQIKKIILGEKLNVIGFFLKDYIDE